MTPQDFIAQIAPYAQQDMQQSHVLASVTIAQAALESAWGKSAPGNNLFGIKGQGQNQETYEYENGQWIQIVDGFRVYQNWLGSIRDHSKFLTDNPRYTNAGFFVCCGNKDYKGACQALQSAGYATDPNYADKLINIIESWNLNQYDEVAEVKYSDTQGHWAENVIDVVSNLGIMKGYDDGTFKPDQPVTRAELAKVVNDLVYMIKH